jgi:molybdopterin-containing oxidoreductase family membrane subunit
MSESLTFADKEEFLEGLRRLVRDGVPADRIQVYMPFPLPEVDDILPRKQSQVRFFALFGAASGTAAGFAFTILTSIEWGIIVGGKPVVSLPPFIIIAFELTILFGALSTFLGFLLLSRVPSLRRIRSKEEFGNMFVIVVEEGGPG